jgi:hypothetical protein
LSVVICLVDVPGQPKVCHLHSYILVNPTWGQVCIKNQYCRGGNNGKAACCAWWSRTMINGCNGSLVYKPGTVFRGPYEISARSCP